MKNLSTTEIVNKIAELTSELQARVPSLDALHGLIQASTLGNPPSVIEKKLKKALPKVTTQNISVPENDSRVRIDEVLAVIQASNRSLTFKQICSRVGRGSNASISAHLNQLSGKGLLIRKGKSSKYRYLAKKRDSGRKVYRHLITKNNVLDAVSAANKPMTVRNIKRAIGKGTYSGVTAHLRRLTHEGALIRNGTPKNYSWEVNRDWKPAP